MSNNNSDWNATDGYDQRMAYLTVDEYVAAIFMDSMEIAYRYGNANTIQEDTKECA